MSNMRHAGVVVQSLSRSGSGGSLSIVQSRELPAIALTKLDGLSSPVHDPRSLDSLAKAAPSPYQYSPHQSTAASDRSVQTSSSQRSLWDNALLEPE